MPRCAECDENCQNHVIDDRRRILCHACGREEAERQTRADAPGVWPEWANVIHSRTGEWYWTGEFNAQGEKLYLLKKSLMAPRA